MDPAFERALADVRASLSAPRPLREALAAAAVRLRKLPRYSGVYLYALEGDVLELRAHAGRDTPHARIPVGSGICGLSARTGQAVIVEDVRKDPRYLACSAETQSEIVVPIQRGERTLAEIDVDSDERAAFGPADRVFLSKVAALLAPLFP